jgi:predicted ATP-dependent endonuclease of OLD family
MATGAADGRPIWTDGVIQRVEVDHFKAFERFTLYLRGDALLAGPNNAGKSTLIAAIRTIAKMSRFAAQRNASENVVDKGYRAVAHAFPYGRFGLVEENLRHEFRDEEARITAFFRNGTRLTAVWPPDPTTLDPFFYVLDGDIALSAAKDVRSVLPSIGTIPVLSPIDHQEAVLTSPRYIRDNLDSHLASRHFRNQLALLETEPYGEDYDAFIEFAAPWIPELTLGRIITRVSSEGAFHDFFVKETGSRIEKELFWEGDGLQVWLQILLHTFRLRNEDVIVLDEPEVFLHPDLERRLVRLLDSLDAQTIAATHSPELLAEAPAESVVWVDKVRRRSVRAPETAVLGDLMAAIGTQFNIRLARALRAKRVLFFEGDEMKLLRHVAETLGATRLVHEVDIAIIPLRGYSNWDRVEPFAWLMRDLLHDAVDVFVILDRDYRTDDQVRSVLTRLNAIGVHGHVWKRKELESYLLEPRTIADILKVSESEAVAYLDEASADFQQVVAEARASEAVAHVDRSHRAAERKRVHLETRTLWDDARARLHACPAKDVLSRLNQLLERDGRKALTFARLARSMKADDVPHELRVMLERVSVTEMSATGIATAALE